MAAEGSAHPVHRGRSIGPESSTALGAIVIFAATRLIDLGEFRRPLAFRHSEFILTSATCRSALIFDILYGVLLGVALSVAEMPARIAVPTMPSWSWACRASP
ncbi:hypothetical protein Hesp01_65190 [Herbidospora sp. NBRC 101105]|nr:hypothetical protein Hesp01_65190 [Herbidospora sp. NBRC 101105]